MVSYSIQTRRELSRNPAPSLKKKSTLVDYSSVSIINRIDINFCWKSYQNNITFRTLFTHFFTALQDFIFSERLGRRTERKSGHSTNIDTDLVTGHSRARAVRGGDSQIHTRTHSTYTLAYSQQRIRSPAPNKNASSPTYTAWERQPNRGGIIHIDTPLLVLRSWANRSWKWPGKSAARIIKMRPYSRGRCSSTSRAPQRVSAS